MNALHRYLARRADLLHRPLFATSTEGIRHVVVIPVLAECAHLSATLKSLAANPAERLGETLVVCVVNNRAASEIPAEWLADNREVLQHLDKAVRDRRGGTIPPTLRIGYVDASSPGKELGPKQGVGTARKLGMDHGLAVLARNGAPSGILFSLDADTTVEPNYLDAGVRALSGSGGWGAVFDYAHPLDGPPDEVAAIICYELYLRYHTLGLRYAGSPYAYPAIGSAMACRAEAYAAVAGMNQRQGGEDFYFLQELAKTGGVRRVMTTTVHPSSRPSDRVPFGTGPRVRRFLDGGHPEYRLYHPESYGVVRDWLRCVTNALDLGADRLLAEATAMSPVLDTFLRSNDFLRVWPRLRDHAADEAALLRQFHRWFDGLKTLRLIHALRDETLPEIDMFEAIPQLLQLAGWPVPEVDFVCGAANLKTQQGLLRHLHVLENATDR